MAVLLTCEALIFYGDSPSALALLDDERIESKHNTDSLCISRTSLGGSSLEEEAGPISYSPTSGHAAESEVVGDR